MCRYEIIEGQVALIYSSWSWRAAIAASAVQVAERGVETLVVGDIVDVAVCWRVRLDIHDANI